jgi:cytidylate kinase
MAIIAMTQHIGTRAVELGRAASELLGYRFLTSDDLYAEVAERYRFPSAQMVILDERRPHFWERLKADTARFVAFFRAVALKEMAADRLVVVSRAITLQLPPYRCGLRVRLVGPLEERVKAVVLEEKLAPAIAERRVRDYDRELRARVQTVYNMDLDDPVNFDLTLNSYALPLAMQAKMLAELALDIDQTIGPENWQQMRDAAVAAEVHAALMLHPKIGHAPLEVQCDKGRVQVNGPGLVPPWDGLIHDVARQVEGVHTVEVIADEQPMPVRPS